MGKSDAYYNELFEDLVEYADWNPDEMLNDEDLQKQLKSTLKGKYSSAMFNRMRNTDRYQQTILTNFDSEISALEMGEGVSLTPEERERIRDRAIEKEAIAIEFKAEIEAGLTPRMVRGLNIAGLIKGKPTLVRKDTVTIKGNKVIRYRDRLGRFASLRK